MKRYTVSWWQEARDDLARLWLRSDDRPGVSQAANAIDQELAENPTRGSTPGHEGLLRLEIMPICVQLTIDEADRQVHVWSVRLISEP